MAWEVPNRLYVYMNAYWRLQKDEKRGKKQRKGKRSRTKGEVGSQKREWMNLSTLCLTTQEKWECGMTLTWYCWLSGGPLSLALFLPVRAMYHSPTLRSNSNSFHCTCFHISLLLYVKEHSRYVEEFVFSQLVSLWLFWIGVYAREIKQ